MSTDGRILLINCEFEGTNITLINVYAPNLEKQRIQFFTKLYKEKGRFGLKMADFAKLMKLILGI